MLKLVFKNDGSIKYVQLPQYVTQGTSGVESVKLAVAFEDKSDNFSAIGYFKLPNGDTVPLALLDTDEFELFGETYPCKCVYLDDSVTLYEGIVLCSIRVTKDVGSTQLYTYNFRLTVNPTTYEPDDTDSHISNAQYQNLADQLDELITNISSIVEEQFEFEDDRILVKKDLIPSQAHTFDLGSNGSKWKKLYISDSVIFPNSVGIFYHTNYACIGINSKLLPDVGNSRDIGSSTLKFKDIYLSGKLSDGTNEISVYEMTTKVDKISFHGSVGYNRVYAVDYQNNQTYITATPYIHADHLVQRTENGDIYVNEVPGANDTEQNKKYCAASKAYVDTSISEATVPGASYDSAPTQNSNNLVRSGGIYTALTAKEDVANKVTSISASSTDTDYPSAKSVYDAIALYRHVIRFYVSGEGTWQGTDFCCEIINHSPTLLNTLSLIKNELKDSHCYSETAYRRAKVALSGDIQGIHRALYLYYSFNTLNQSESIIAYSESNSVFMNESALNTYCSFSDDVHRII